MKQGSGSSMLLFPSRLVYRGRHASFVVGLRPVVVTLCLVAATVLAAFFVLTLGRVTISFAEVVAILSGRGGGGMREQIVMNLRVPRMLVAIFAGAALGASGAVFQSISRNALGSPDVIGFTTGAATGALVQIVVFGNGPLAVAFSALIGGLGVAAVVYALSFRHGVASSYRLLLVGIGVGSILNAVNGLMLVKGNLDNAVSANLWLAGSLDARNWGHAISVVIGSLLLLPVVVLAAKRLRMIEMGDDLARQLGIPVERTRFGMIVCAVLLAGIATGAAGPIAFLALAAPQLAARLTASRGVPVLSGAAMGAFLLVVADLATQLVAGSLVLPIGRTTGLLGGLYLLWLLTRRTRA